MTAFLTAQELGELMLRTCGNSLSSYGAAQDSDGKLVLHLFLSRDEPGLKERIVEMMRAVAGQIASVSVHLPLGEGIVEGPWRVQYSQDTECFFVTFTRDDRQEYSSAVPRDEFLEHIDSDLTIFTNVILPPTWRIRAERDGFGAATDVRNIGQLQARARASRQQLRAMAGLR